MRERLLKIFEITEPIRKETQNILKHQDMNCVDSEPTANILFWLDEVDKATREVIRYINQDY